MLSCLLTQYKTCIFSFFIFALLTVSVQGFFPEKTQASALDITRASTDLKQDLKKTPIEQRSLFYEEYLEKYFPRALVIRGRFLANMSPQKINQTLEDIVMLLKTDTAFYFVNETDRVKIGFYWEAIVDQISLISEFLKKAYVDLNTKTVFLLEPLMFGIGSAQMNCSFVRNAKTPLAPMKQLLVFMRENRLESIGKFYATYFDFLVKLFNEGILFKDLQQSQIYLHELEFVMTKLRGTTLERQYQEPLNVCKELFAILQANIAAIEEEGDEFDDQEDNDEHHPTTAGATTRRKSNRRSA